MTITLSGLPEPDVVPVARPHRVAFPDFYLSSIGEPFLVQFYRGFLSDPAAVAVVAHDGVGLVRGSTFGTLAQGDFFRRLLVRRWPGFVAASVRAAVASPSIKPRLLRATTNRGDTDDRSGEWVAQAQIRGARRRSLTTDGNEAVNASYLANRCQLSGRHVTRQDRDTKRCTTALAYG